MLIYFKVGNFKSIKEPVILNFNAASIGEHPDSNLVTTERHQLLKSMLLYGHNASGKSKILNAFSFFKDFVTLSAIKSQGGEKINIIPFRLNTETEKRPSFFEASFLLDGFTWRYGFELDSEKVHKEWLLQSKAEKEYPVFLRIGNEYEINSKRFENAQGLEKRTRDNALYLSVASQWNVPQAEAINKWFNEIFILSGLASNRTFKQLTIELLAKKGYSKLILEFLKKADLSIQDIEISDDQLLDESVILHMSPETRANWIEFLKREGKGIKTLHQKFDKKNKAAGTVKFNLDDDESEGTQKYFSLIGVLLQSIYENRLVIIDEFDARLHTLLSKAILKLFNSSTIKTKGQLLIASHDTALLDKNILRRDQIYFVEKDNYGASHVTSLVEYKPRKESPYDRNYLDGKYGAIPFIDDLEKLVANGQKKI